ncbi:Hypothetical_protein [Hexamita inflata]|uniref:Hypothetical_protein n=1 Tax=Hexamita inflata TaxID=28002 RepID=A0AA86QI58_9EUKA|nr:Hypothetical protein HINF_LOCUS47524 [Hexamita inflata]
MDSIGQLVNLKELDIIFIQKYQHNRLVIFDESHLFNFEQLQFSFYLSFKTTFEFGSAGSRAQLNIVFGREYQRNEELKIVETLRESCTYCFTSVEKHQNFNNRDQFSNRCFDVSDQINELKTANKMRNVEFPNNSFKQIQNKRKTVQTELKSFNQIINAALNKINQIKFTSSVVRLIELLDQTVSQ